jgi:transposase-like protein
VAITIGGLGQSLFMSCPSCKDQMTHWCVAGGGRVRFEWRCKPCELSLKSDKSGYAKLSDPSAII